MLFKVPLSQSVNPRRESHFKILNIRTHIRNKGSEILSQGGSLNKILYILAFFT